MKFSHGDTVPVFHPEFGRFMLEATPGKPWGIGFKDLLDVEPNMKRRLVNITDSSLSTRSADVLKEGHSKGPYGTKRISYHTYDLSTFGHER